MDYTVQFTRRRDIALLIGPDARLLVRAPFGTPQAAIRRAVEAHRDWIARQQERQRQCPRTPPTPEPTEEEQQTLRRQAQALLPGRVDYWARRMGLSPAGVRITAARSRYGSCSTQGRLCFSLFLLLSPAEAIDAVVVHELAHLRYMDHSPAFYRLVESVLPDYRQRTARLVKPPPKNG